LLLLNIQEILPNEGTDEEYDRARENVGKIECKLDILLYVEYLTINNLSEAELEAHLQEIRERLGIDGIYYDTYRYLTYILQF